eukprot:s492_g3.t1
MVTLAHFIVFHGKTHQIFTDSAGQRLCARLDAVDFKLTAALAAGTPWASLEVLRAHRIKLENLGRMNYALQSVTSTFQSFFYEEKEDKSQLKQEWKEHHFALHVYRKHIIESAISSPNPASRAAAEAALQEQQECSRWSDDEGDQSESDVPEIICDVVEESTLADLSGFVAYCDPLQTPPVRGPRNYLTKLRSSLRSRTAIMAEPWRCRRCWKVASGRHTHCPHCGGRWDRVQDLSFVPGERQSTPGPKSRGRKAKQEQGWEWNADENDEAEHTTNRERSGSRRQRQRRGRRKNQSRHVKEEEEDEDGPPYATPSLPPPWKPETALKETATTQAVPAMDAEMARDLREQYPDAAEMPEGVRKVLEKHEVWTGKQLTSAMLRVSKAVGNAQDDLRKLQDAKVKHRSTWLKHLKALVGTISKQLDSFDKQQDDYSQKIRATRNKIQVHRREMQRLNAQAAADNRADLQANLGEEEANPEIVVDVEEASLRTQVTDLLAKCLKQTEVEAYGKYGPCCAASPSQSDFLPPVHSAAYDEDDCTFPFLAIHQAYRLSIECETWTEEYKDPFFNRFDSEPTQVENIASLISQPRSLCTRLVTFSPDVELRFDIEGEVGCYVDKPWRLRPHKPTRMRRVDLYQHVDGPPQPPEFERPIPGLQAPDNPIEQQPDHIQELAAILQEQGPYPTTDEDEDIFYVMTWYLHGRLQREWRRPRLVRLTMDFLTWTDSIRQHWRDQLQPRMATYFQVVFPDPPPFFADLHIAQVIVFQAP